MITASQTINQMVSIAQTIQNKAQQVDHLIATCEEALEDVASIRPGLEAARKEAGERLNLFLELSRTLAREIAKLGEQVEIADFNLRHSKEV